jgi:hypothetical protein
MKMKPRTHGASEKGFHFLEGFKQCKRKFFIHEVLGIEPERKPFQLLFGSAFHAGKEAFYLSGSVAKARKAMMSELDAIRGQMEDERRIYPVLKTKAPIMLDRWIKVLGANDLSLYRILAVEEIGEVKLPNGFTFTFKPDVVLQVPSGPIYIFDTKTSWYSSHLQAEQVEVGDQASTYLYGWNHLHPKLKASGVVADCISWNLATDDPEKIQVIRSNLTGRTPLELWEWEQGAMSDLRDMASRVKALSKSSYSQLFPRTTSYCLSYNRKCEYLDICRSDLTTMKSLPGGFCRIQKSKDLAGLGRMKDSIPLVQRPTGKVVK